MPYRGRTGPFYCRRTCLRGAGHFSQNRQLRDSLRPVLRRVHPELRIWTRLSIPQFQSPSSLFAFRSKAGGKNSGCVSIFGLLDLFDARALMEFAPMLLIVEAVSNTDELIRFCDGEVSRFLPSHTVCFAFAWWDLNQLLLSDRGRKRRGPKEPGDADGAGSVGLAPTTALVEIVWPKRLSASKQLPGNAGILVGQSNRCLVRAGSKRQLSCPALRRTEVFAAN